MSKQENNNAAETNAPTLIAYHVPDREKAPWTKIGAAWGHKDERGFTLQLDLLPVGDGRVVLREFDPKMIEEEAESAS